MLLTGRWLTAEEALRAKLVNKVVTRAELLPEAERFASIIKVHSPLVLSRAKQAVTRGLDLSLAGGLELESRLGGYLLAHTMG